MNGKLIQNHDATVISFMSSLGCFYIIYFLYQNKFTADFCMSINNCSHVDFSLHLYGYVFTASVKDEKN
jgi:hypothetical protein